MINYDHTEDRVYSKLTSENPIDLVRCQLANCYRGRAGLINSGGAAGGETDLSDAVRTASLRSVSPAVLQAVKLTSAMQCVLRLSTNAQAEWG